MGKWIKPIKEKTIAWIAPIWEKVKARRENKVNNWVTYFPVFSSEEELTSHYHRACWYLPKVEGKCERVFLFQKIGSDVRPGERPNYMCAPQVDTSHIRVLRGMASYLKTLYRSRLILVWKYEHLWLFNLLKLLGIQSVYVNTQDPDAKEYGAYCGLFWKYLLNDKERQLVIQDNYERFCKIADKIYQKQYKKACVFGTGPSLEDAYEFDFSHCLTIVCNSIVQNRQLLDHISPEFICAGDVVSHLGVSRYAEVFRKDLIEALKERDVYFVTTAPFGYLFLLNHPEVREKTILIEQTTDEPNYNLIQLFGLPRLDSTLNIHMLPIASTFVDELFILGCDGKSDKRDNEDFWAHASGAQYNDLVHTGHDCHPTFDINRKKSTYNRHLDSVYVSISCGESTYNKKYYTLKPSNITALKNKTIPEEWKLASNGNLLQIMNFPSDKETKEKCTLAPKSDLAFKASVSNVNLDSENILYLKGWALNKVPIDKIEVYFGEDYFGRAQLGIHRPDLFKKYPEYQTKRSGFIFIKKIPKANKLRNNITLKFYVHGKAIGEVQKNLK